MLKIINTLKKLFASSFSVTQAELSLCNMFTLKTTVSEVNIAVQNNKIKHNVLMILVGIIPMFLNTFIRILLLFLGNLEDNEVFKAVFTTTLVILCSMVLFLSQTRFSRLVYYAQFMLFFTHFLTTILLIYGYLPYSKLDVEFLEVI